MLKESFPEVNFPQYLTFDICELVFSFIRIGKFSGRQTNLDAVSLALGLEARNKKSELSGASDVAGQYGHSGGRTILQQTVPLDHEEPLTYQKTDSVCKGKELLSRE